MDQNQQDDQPVNSTAATMGVGSDTTVPEPPQAPVVPSMPADQSVVTPGTSMGTASAGGPMVDPTEPVVEPSLSGVSMPSASPMDQTVDSTPDVGGMTPMATGTAAEPEDSDSTPSGSGGMSSAA